MPISKKTRFEVFKRDGFACQYCGSKSPQVMLQVDHVLAIAQGGKDSTDNLVTSCWPCNIGKGARLLDFPDLDRKIADNSVRSLPKELHGFMRDISAYSRSLGGFYHMPAGPYLVSVNDATSDPVQVDFFPVKGSGSWTWKLPKSDWHRGRVLDSIASWTPAG